MFGYNLLLVLLGTGASTWAAPTLPRTNDDHPPPGCIGWVWELAKICILSPPTTTIGPSTKRDDIQALSERDVDTITLTSSTKRGGEPEALVHSDDTTPTPTWTDDCIPIILAKFNICIAAPPTTTIVPSARKAERNSLGPPTTGGLVPDKSIPGGPILPDKYIPGGSLVPDVTVPGEKLTPSS